MFFKGAPPFQAPLTNTLREELADVVEYMEGKLFILRRMIDAETIKDTQRYY